MFETKINAYTYWDAKPHFLLSADTENFWVMYIIESGTCYYKIAEHHGQAHRGDILICPPAVTFQREVLTPLSFHFFRFNFEQTIFTSKALIGQQHSTNTRIFEDCRTIHQFEFEFSKKIAALKNHMLTDIFYNFLYQETNYTQNLNYTNPDITAIIHYIEENYSASLKLKDLAAMANLSSEYLSRKFHKIVGKSPSCFIESVRMQHAQELLINTKLSLNEIASQIGYNDGLYFSRKFHKFTHQWPSDFRTKHLL